MQQVDFLPPSFHKKVHQRKLAVWKLWFGAMVLLAVCSTVAWDYWALHLKTQLLGELQMRLEVERQTVGRRQALLAERVQLQQTKRLTDSLRSPIEGSVVMREVIRNLPPEVGLTRFELEQPHAEGEQMPSKGARSKNRTSKTHEIVLHLQGVAPDDEGVRNYVEALRGQPLFTAVVVNAARTQELRGMVSRTFELTLNIDLDRSFAYHFEEGVADAG